MKFIELYDENGLCMLNLATITSYRLVDFDDGTQQLTVASLNGTEYYTNDNIQDCIDALNKIELYNENNELCMLNLATITSYRLVDFDDGTQQLTVESMDGYEFYTNDNIQDCIDALNKDDNDPKLYNRKV